MGGFICEKPCRFGNVEYAQGDMIPLEAVSPNRIRAMVSNGYIIPVSDVDRNKTTIKSETKAMLEVPVDDGGLSITLTLEDTIKVFELLQMTVENVENAIKSIDKENVLIVLHATDSRKAVKSAAQKRASELGHNQDEEVADDLEKSDDQ